jgi:hypothetical protein
MEETILKARYPIIGCEDFLEVSITGPKIDGKDFFSTCKISAPDFEKKFDVYGIDPLQSIWISLRQIKVEIIDFEKKKGLKCEYYFFQDVEHDQLPIE